MGISVAAAYIISSRITLRDRPFPTSSSMYRHMNCIISTNITMKNVRIIGPKYDLRMNLWMVFIDYAFRLLPYKGNSFTTISVTVNTNIVEAPEGMSVL